ncbi:zf-DHHC-domain-containing protein [Vararia minispora EC-137]|uniref:Zf-DHHC-domain-containing protein n=1 Tax=Vararia minispora EC-137 TaxID=1314806 RepID=A0ACB8QYM9_9AGAM|nr:zf-DHHC-domain-containing protein [Vararia minispora EC-137]
MPSALPRCVFTCFRSIERWADRLTGFAGPYFVGLATILFTLGTLCFLEIVLPSLPYPFFTAPPCFLILLNLFSHYYYACTVPPGFVGNAPTTQGLGWRWASARKDKHKRGVSWSEELNITPARLSMCSKCKVTRPERAHHCRVCNRCVLKYDHHCPVRINQCVGINNERHFVLFMAYLVIATFFFALLGFPHVADAFGLNSYEMHWNYYIPAIYFAITYILCLVMSFAVAVMLGWHLFSVSVGETAVEAHDHDTYRRIAKERGGQFVNSYDLGNVKNLQLFFNVGMGRYPWYTLVVPLRVPPYTDGSSWARRPGLDRHSGIRAEEELTDEED